MRTDVVNLVNEMKESRMLVFDTEQLSNLVELSQKGLESMLDHATKRFCNRMILKNGCVVRDGDSYRYTLISLLGLQKLRQARGIDKFNIDALLSSQIKSVGDLSSAGDAGLILWLTSLAHPRRLAEVFEILSPETLLSRFSDARSRKTTELSWLLTGLSYAKLASTNYPLFIDELARNTFQYICENYAESGIFRHEGKNTLTGKIRGHIGVFADQVYPIYALSIYSTAFGNSDAAKMAKACADRICELQGEKGQWWWYYNADNGKVAGHYPVYSVHQDGMAPMALYAVQQIIRSDYSRNIEKGLTWIYGNNELKFNMIDRKHNMIWRCIWMGKRRRDVDLLRATLGHKPSADHDKLRVLFECRSYHLGWLLYAFADKL